MRAIATSSGIAGPPLILAALLTAFSPPSSAHGQAFPQGSLDGDWVRLESTYQPFDRMRITVQGNTATLTHVPTAALGGFRVGQNLWTAIQADGSLQVLGNDGGYYEGILKREGPDSLHLAVQWSAAGNVQIWRRAGPSIDGEWVRVAPGDPSDGMRVRVEQDQASIRFLPASAPRPLRTGSRLWQGIRAGGALEVLGSRGRYESATIALQREDRLHVTPSGSFSRELWVRPSIADAARAELLNPPTDPAVCLASSLFDHQTGLVTGWNLSFADNHTATAESLGVLEYHGGAPGRASIITDIERSRLPFIRHDFAFVWQKSPSGRILSAHHTDLTAAQYAAEDQSQRDAGYRAMDIEAYATSQGIRYAGVWVSNPEGIDWTADHSLTSSEFGQVFGQRRDQGYRLIDVEAYSTPQGTRYASIWYRSCDNANWREWRDMDRDNYQARVDSLSALGFRVVDFESYGTSNGQRYAAIWERVPGVAWAVHSDRTLAWFLNYHRRYTDEGYRLVDYEVYETEDGLRYAGVWAENDPRLRFALKQMADDSVEAYRTTNRIPGISVAIMLNGEVIYSRGFGWADSARAKQAYSGTVYATASVAKIFGGTLAARLEQRGVLDLSRPTRDFLDSLPARHTHTVEQLLAKTGCVWHYPEGPEPSEMVYRWRAPAVQEIQDSSLLAGCTPGGRYHYSTHGFTFAGAVLEEVTGKDIGQLINEELALPIGLRTLRIAEGRVPSAAGVTPRYRYHLAQPYRFDWPTQTNVLTDYEDTSWKVLGGGLQIDAPDLARFGWFVLNGWVVSDSIRDNRLWRSLTGGLRTWSDTTANAPNVGLAWEMRQRNGRRVAEHGGSWDGARSQLAVYRDDNLVIAVLTNQRETSVRPAPPPPGQTPTTPPVPHPVPNLAHQLARIVLNNLP